MAVIELQIREQRFVDLFVARFNNSPLPAATLDFPAELKGLPLERLECLGATVEALSETELRISADVVFHFHASLDEVRAAGSLNRPPSQTLRRSVPFSASIGMVKKSEDNDELVPALRLSVAGDPIPAANMILSLPPEIQFAAGAVVLGDGVVALRIGTTDKDSLTTPVRSEVGGDDWAQVIGGQFFADILVASLERSIEGVLSDDTYCNRGPGGAWVSVEGMGRFAAASAEITKIKACFGYLNIEVELIVRADLQTSGQHLITALTLTGDADSTLCDFAGLIYLGPIGAGVVHAIAEDKVAAEVLGKAKPEEGFHEIRRTDRAITYERTSLIPTPSSAFVLTGSEIGERGLVARGSLQFQRPRRGLEGEATPPISEHRTNCGRRSVDVHFEPASVALRDIGAGTPRLFAARFEPADAWVVVPGPTNSHLDLSLKFVDPPTGRLPAGTATSVFLFTDCGVRWADLGTIPPEQEQASIGQIAEMISECMAISDSWGDGAMNLGWLVDPPDVQHGIDLVRQWSVGFRELPAGARIELLARAADGEERVVAVVENAVEQAVLVTTAAHETLVIRAGQSLSAPAPTVSQRWLVPFASLALEAEPVAMAATDGLLALRDVAGATHLIDVAAGAMATTRTVDAVAELEPAFAPALTALSHEVGRVDSAWTGSARIDRGTVAVAHQGALLLAAVGRVQQLQ